MAELLEAKENTKARLDEIEKELQDLSSKQFALKSRWKAEKSIIEQIRLVKSQIEQSKLQADEYERKGDLAKVAEIRYSTLIDYEKKLKELNSKLNSLQASGVLLKEEVDDEDIAEIVAKWTGIPVHRMLETEKSKLVQMETRIHERLIGQDDAVAAVANSIRRSRAGLQEENRPIGVFIFIGTTGVGKTELARSLAEFLFDDESSLVRIDMSEYMEKYSVSRLIGAPPGYVGYEEGGQLTEAVRQKPYSVVLLDEIEKAHLEIFNVLLQVLDDGRLTDGKGRIVNFKNTIIIMTSNLGTEILQDKLKGINENNRNELMAEARVKIANIIRHTLRPEFLNRVDEIVLFKPLTKNEILRIADIQMDKLQKRLRKTGINIFMTQEAKEWLSEIGYDPQYGARPLKRAIQKYISDSLAYKILNNEFISGDIVKIGVSDNRGFSFDKE